MLVSPRPTALLPSTGAGDYSPVTGTKGSRRPPYIPPEDGYIAQHSPRQAPLPTSPSIGIPVGSATKEDSRQTLSRLETTPQTKKQELARADSATSVKSRDSTSSMQRTISRDSMSSSMKRTMSKDSMSSRKGPRQFVVKTKASRGHRPSHIARTPSYSKGIHQISSLTMTQVPSPTRDSHGSKQTIIKTPPSSGNTVRRKALSMSTQEGAPTPPMMRRTFSDENGNLI